MTSPEPIAFALPELTVDHEALRLAFIEWSCPLMNPTELDEATRAHLSVVNALLATKQAIAALAEILNHEVAPLGVAMKKLVDSSALTQEEQAAIGRMLVSKLIDAKPAELSAHWRRAAEAVRAAVRAEFKPTASNDEAA